MNLIAIDLLKEELDISISLNHRFERIDLLKDAIQELQLIIESDCLTCRYNCTQEELSELNEEEYINAFDKCRTCSNYYPNNFEEK